MLMAFCDHPTGLVFPIVVPPIRESFSKSKPVSPPSVKQVSIILSIRARLQCLCFTTFI